MAAKRPDGELDLFSGVFARFAGHPLVLTASHCLKDAVLARILSESKPVAGTVPRVVAGRGYKDTDALDVMFLELAPEEADELAPDSIAEAQLSSEALKVGDVVCLHGYPSAFARITEGEQSELTRGGVVFATEVVGIGEAGGGKPDDIRLKFDSRFCFDVETGNMVTPPKAFGMSGCGAFSLGPLREGVLWTPADISLVGIQSKARHGAEGLLVVQRIELLLELLRGFYDS